MKKYFKYAAFVFLLYIGVSCESYLETKSNSTFTEETVFTNLDFANKLIFSIYSNLASNTMFTYNYLFYQLDSDIEFNASADDGGVRQAAHYAATDGTSNLKETWNMLYSCIEVANICIDNLPKSPIWKGDYEKEARSLYGEAITLRAYCYFQLVTLWGDVPFKLKSTQDGDNYNLPKTDRDSIYEYLIKDLKDVEDYVPWMNANNTSERVNKAYTKGLRAKMALTYAGFSLRNKTFETRRGRHWQEYYQIANQECREIMESGKHRLNPNFKTLFKAFHSYQMDMNYKESIFEIAFGRLVSGRICETIGMSHSTSDKKYGRAASQVYLPLNYYYTFDKSDIRRDVSIEVYNYANTKYLGQQSLANSVTAITPCKWRREWIVPSMGGDLYSTVYTGVNFPLMRYADIVLMFAETENEINGPTQDAKNALTLIRQRAFSESMWPSKVTNYIASISASKETFFNAIVNERGWEFGGELIRKNDLVRWNLLGPKIKQMKEECQKIVNNDPAYAGVPDYIFWKMNDDGETINILNSDYRLPDTAISGYTRSSWWPVMSSSAKTTFNQVMDRCAHGYDAAKNNHLYPISAQIITASNGVLSNDQMP